VGERFNDCQAAIDFRQLVIDAIKWARAIKLKPTVNDVSRKCQKIGHRYPLNL
jgi:hypothetical protein